MVDFTAFPAEAHAYFEAAQGRVPWEEVFTPGAVVRDVDRATLSYSPEVDPRWRNVPLPVESSFPIRASATCPLPTWWYPAGGP